MSEEVLRNKYLYERKGNEVGVGIPQVKEEEFEEKKLDHQGFDSEYQYVHVEESEDNAHGEEEYEGFQERKIKQEREDIQESSFGMVGDRNKQKERIDSNNSLSVIHMGAPQFHEIGDVNSSLNNSQTNENVNNNEGENGNENENENEIIEDMGDDEGNYIIEDGKIKPLLQLQLPPNYQPQEKISLQPQLLHEIRASDECIKLEPTLLTKSKISGEKFNSRSGQVRLTQVKWKDVNPLTTSQKSFIRNWAKVDRFKGYEAIKSQEGFSHYYTTLTERLFAEKNLNPGEWDLEAVRQQLITYRRSLHTSLTRGRKRKFEENEEHKLYFADDIQETPDLISDPHVEETKQE